MRHNGLPEMYVRIFQSFFRGTRSAVRINGELTDWFDVNSGTDQGNIQGPPVLNFSLNFATFLVETNKTISQGAVLQKGNTKVEEKVILDTDSADDMAILDNSGEGLQESTDLLAHYSSYAGLKINAKKTQCMAVSKCAPSVLLSGETVLSFSLEVNPLSSGVLEHYEKQMKHFEVFHQTSLRRILRIKWF
ncbi:hypothetical protein ACHWQZ_G005576 [Mnemiopsis leidyi]